MGIQSGRSLLALLLFTPVTSAPRACGQPPEKTLALSPRAVYQASSRSMVFGFDGVRITPTQLHNTRAELLYDGRGGGYVLPKPWGKELHIVFRDRRNRRDTIYKVYNGSGEIMYFYNNDNQSWVMGADRQPIIEVSDGRLWSVDTYRGDPEDELLRALEVNDLTLMSKLVNAIPSLANVPFYGGMTLLMLGNDPRIARMALDAGANVDAKDLNGNTALHYAVYYGNQEMAELLLTRKANINAQNSSGNTPLHFATLVNDVSFTDFLTGRGADGSIRNGERRTPLGIAMDN